MEDSIICGESESEERKISERGKSNEASGETRSLFDKRFSPLADNGTNRRCGFRIFFVGVWFGWFESEEERNEC